MIETGIIVGLSLALGVFVYRLSRRRSPLERLVDEMQALIRTIGKRVVPAFQGLALALRPLAVALRPFAQKIREWEESHPEA